jgi:hypothetical protein
VIRSSYERSESEGKRYPAGGAGAALLQTPDSRFQRAGERSYVSGVQRLELQVASRRWVGLRGTLPICQSAKIGEACNALARDRPCTATLFTPGARPRFAPATARGDVSPGEVRSVFGVIIDRYSS